MQNNLKSGRRAFLKASALLAVALTPSLKTASAATVAPSLSSGEFTYEVTRTDDEWEKRLSSDEFRILRLGKTEQAHSHPFTKTTNAGNYSCRGCDLQIYGSSHKVMLDMGWVFFKHSEPNSVLTGLDGSLPYGEGSPDSLIEAHCRRCGSHLGHILIAGKDLVHCINGTSLKFSAA